MTSAEPGDGNRKTKAQIVTAESIAAAARQRGTTKTTERTTGADIAVTKKQDTPKGNEDKVLIDRILLKGLQEFMADYTEVRQIKDQGETEGN